MRRQRRGQIALGEGRQRRNDQLRATNRLADVRGRPGYPHIPHALEIADPDRATGANRFERGGVAPPEADLMPRLGHIGRRRIRAVSTAEHCYFHEILNHREDVIYFNSKIIASKAENERGCGFLSRMPLGRPFPSGVRFEAP